MTAVLSRGQSRVERCALAAARACGFQTATPSDDWVPLVFLCDATVVLGKPFKAVEDACREEGKPYLLLREWDTNHRALFRLWLERNRIGLLHVVSIIGDEAAVDSFLRSTLPRCRL